MKLTRLRISGFKSFAEPCELELADGLTGIVGPNGCGKSNIVEALRWVMGESSARGLRGTEMEDVIFAGAATRPPFDFAEVVLAIEGPVPEIAAPGETVELSRRIGRGSGSTFRLRGREVRARDVQIMFADAASGARSAAIVGQGEIARIVDAKPDHRRRLLEEAAGIGGLHARRREAELRLQATLRNLELLEQRLGQLAERRSQLARQAREAERYRKLQAELRRLEGLRLMARWRSEEAARAGAEAELRQVEAEIAALLGRRAGLRRECDAAAAEARALEERRAALAGDLARLEERLAAAARLQEENRRAREAIAARLAALDATLARESEAAADARTRLDRLDARHRELEAALPALEAERRRAETERADLEGQLAASEAALEQATVRALQSEAALSAARSRLVELEERGAALVAGPDETADDGEEAVAALREEIGALAQALAESEDRIRALEAERTRLEAAREETATALAEADAALSAAAGRRREAEAALRERRAALQALAEKRALLERQLARLDERLARLEEALAALAPGDAEARLAAARRALAAHQPGIAALRQALADAEEHAKRAREALAAAEAACREDATLCARLESEVEALTRLLPDTPEDALLHRLRLPDERARAIAALLGDDLLLGTDPAADSFWREEVGGRVPDGHEPGPPEGCEPLALGLDLPPALRRVLGAAGFVRNGEAERLQPRLRAGQCLVSRDGGLWRWDGLVRRPGATDEAARRLAVERQLTESRRLLAEAQERRERRERARREHLEACRAAEAECEAARRKLAQAEEAHGRLAGGVAEAERGCAAAQERRSELERERGGLLAERGEVEAEHRRLVADIAGLGEEAPLVAALDLARAAERRAADERDRLRSGLADLARRLRELDGRLGAARDERAARERALGERRTELYRQGQSLAQAREEARLRARERERLAGELEAARADVGHLEETWTAHEEERRRLAVARDTVRRACEEVQSHLAALRERDRDIAAERARIQAEREHLARALATAGERIAAAREEREAAAAELARHERALAPEAGAGEAEAGRDRLQAALAELAARVEAAHDAVEERSRQLEALEGRVSELRERAALLRAEAERAGRAQEETAAEIERRAGLPPQELLAEGGEALQAELASVEPSAIEERIERLRRSREHLGAVNLRAAQEFAEVERELETGRAEEAELRAAIERLQRAIGRLQREGRERLLAAHAEVERHFRALFVRLFGGGRAELRLAEGDEPFAAGLELDAMPPGKKLQHVSLLSGGEKSLAGLALVLAFFLARPSPLCVLDEVDAALDDANVERFVDVLEEIARATGTRFLVVTHHPLTMARMDRLYGVTMSERGVSRLVSVALDRAVELRATA